MEDSVERCLTARSFFENGDEDVSGDRNPDLRFYRVLRRAEEGFDAQVLFDPFEEQFYLPTLLIKLCDRERGQIEVVGEKQQIFLAFGVVERNAA